VWRCWRQGDNRTLRELIAGIIPSYGARQTTDRRRPPPNQPRPRGAAPGSNTARGGARGQHSRPARHFRKV
jgi:hypothetical protein